MQGSKIIDRMEIKAFWKEVSYWSAIKWSGKKTQPIAKEDWLPILTSLFTWSAGSSVFCRIFKTICQIEVPNHGRCGCRKKRGPAHSRNHCAARYGHE